MSPIKARGLLAHKFWGEYLAIIALEFPNNNDAKQVLNKLGSGWTVSENNDNVLRWSGNSKELESCKDILASFVADKDKIDSLKYSVDHGEWFDITVPVANEKQLDLLKEM